ncbi:MAG: hypothetical protein JST50_12820 [Bacteroidetes bacterium]|jgi:hypothetical protein|nr:hypothetical protein [Bacteroidota bacterium]
MSLVSEIKCPHCGAWNPSTGVVDAKCVKCDAYLEPERNAHYEDVKFAEANRQGYYLTISENDEQLTQIYKIFANAIRWSAYYSVMLFFLIMAAIIFIIGLIAL